MYDTFLIDCKNTKKNRNDQGMTHVHAIFFL